MIIKMTVNDNDSTQKLESFLSKFYQRTFFKMFKENMIPIDEIFEFSDKDDALRGILESERMITKEQKTALIGFVRELFEHYVKDNKSKDYLMERLKISISYVFKDEWENGENVYYFTTNNKYITQ